MHLLVGFMGDPAGQLNAKLANSGEFTTARALHHHNNISYSYYYYTHNKNIIIIYYDLILIRGYYHERIDVCS